MVAIATLPLVAALLDATFTGIGRHEAFAYLAIETTALFVAGVVAAAPEAFDLGRFRLGGVFVIAFEITMLLGTPGVYGKYLPDGSTAMFLVTVCVGYALTTLAIAAVPVRAGIARSPRRFEGERPRGGLDVGRVGVALTTAGVAVLVVYLVVTPVVPLLLALRGVSGAELTLAREEALTRLSIPALTYAFGLTRDVLLPTAAAILLFQMIRRRTAAGVVWFGVSVVAALTASAITIEKSPVGRLILVLGVTTWIARGRPLRWRALGLVGLLFVAFPLLVSRQSNSTATSNFAIASVIGERILHVPTNVHYHYVAYVDQDLEQFLLGRTIPNLGKFALGPSVDFTGDVQKRIFPDAVVEGNANGSYISNFYADFGLPGVVVGSLSTGLVIAFLDRLNRRAFPVELGAPLQAVTAVQLIFLTSSSVWNTILQFPFGNLGLMVVVAVVVHLWYPLHRPVTFVSANPIGPRSVVMGT